MRKRAFALGSLLRENKIWKAVIYVRISKEKGEDTLENQKNIVSEHLKSLGNIEVCSVKVDDGYSGLNSNRPAFQELLCEIQKGKYDCIAVRDLSRLSRNHIEAGQYMHENEFYEKIPSFDISRINDTRKQRLTMELNKLSDELWLHESHLKRLYRDFENKIISQSDFEYMRQHHMRKCEISEENIRAIEADVAVNRDAESLLGWIGQYKPFSAFETISRQMLAYLVKRITVDGNKKVQVEFLHEQEYQDLRSMLNMKN